MTDYLRYGPQKRAALKKALTVRLYGTSYLDEASGFRVDVVTEHTTDNLTCYGTFLPQGTHFTFTVRLCEFSNDD